mmetsp:Transcript_20303/g.44371  ORF Transcript_20303/g.44371 Transcript_20303/m.44371 type:complete len:108 (-) Transcript_20303:694-1017(-)|eukprot:CAMPEP_0202903648 /NCGR_PEP_ID=MMETSP1392-20130828/25619_1 /ASSEMBLY_ACC=CAM_ASM_000868 /TAXON_ID=225041 /ORGANISM="Chlamydomonas chlamydogama, Strain SAG 11-48b" /LENGTH=107 /DNA_ID=CAMNT_0049590935 /DNA_START=143 /DNA_END=466 /DNA_ORIENTATION=+
MDIKTLFNGKQSVKEPHADKLAETKKREREIKDALKQQRQEQKEYKREAHLAEAQAYRMERSWNPVSKRAAKDARAAEKHERKKEEGFVCEHGVYKCRICHPVTKHK